MEIYLVLAAVQVLLVLWVPAQIKWDRLESDQPMIGRIGIELAPQGV